MRHDASARQAPAGERGGLAARLLPSPGEANHTLAIPANPAFAGLTLGTQALALDNTVAARFALTNSGSPESREAECAATGTAPRQRSTASSSRARPWALPRASVVRLSPPPPSWGELALVRGWWALTNSARVVLQF